MADALRKDGVMQLRLWGGLAPLGLALAALAFLLDRAHKWWMLSVFDMPNRGPVDVTPFFQLVMAWNKGVSYGLLKSHQQGWLIAMSLLISIVLWIWLCRSDRPLTAAAIALVIGGALGNALDRYLYGAVADFFHFYWGGWSWYVFNVADIAIVAGVALLLYESFRERSAA
jgi:signal peptidase II